MEQRTSEWLEIRKTHITSTDAAIIMGLSPYSSPLELWKRKTGKAPEIEINYAMQEGIDKEEEARHFYQYIAGITIIPQVVFHKEHSWAMASLDGMNFNHDMIVEIKCGKKSLDLAQQGNIPEYYKAQMQHAMWVAGVKKAHYFCYRSELEYMLIDFFRDDEFIEKMVADEKEFYFEYLAPNIPPPPKEDDYIEIDSEEFKIAAEKWLKSKKELEIIQEQEKHYRNNLIDLTDDSNCYGFGVKLQRINRDGQIDWDAVCKKHNINKDELPRKKGIGYWKISEKK